MKQKISKLLPELNELCTHNTELEQYAGCLKETLDEAQREIGCLRETAYKVAQECAAIETKRVILEEKLSKREEEILRLESEKQRLRDKTSNLMQIN